MFYEYALDPAVLAEQQHARFFLDAFGPWKGRFLADYPKDWYRQVSDTIPKEHPSRKYVLTRIEEAQKRRIFSMRPGSQYNSDDSWIVNAETEHMRENFHAIIAQCEATKPHLLHCATVDESHPRWKVEQGVLLSRNASAFAHALRLLLVNSNAIVLIDPFFNPDEPDKVQPLVEFSKLIKGKSVQIDIHCSKKIFRHTAELRSIAESRLCTALPTGQVVRIFIRSERRDGDRVHNRYLLTDICGVQFGDGIESDRPRHKDRVSILEESSRLELWRQYVTPGREFEQNGPPVLITGKGR